MERPLMMVLHAVVISFILYLGMVFILKQNSLIAETRSVYLGCFILLYMITFGHSLPKF